MKTRPLIIMLLSLIALSCIIYISVFAFKIHQTEEKIEKQTGVYQYHIVVGTGSLEKSAEKAFFEGIRDLSVNYNAAAELVRFEGNDNEQLLKTLEYGSYVNADGIILFPSDENFQTPLCMNTHKKQIPVAAAGLSIRSGNEICHVSSSVFETGKLFAEEILKGKWKKTAAVLKSGNNQDETLHLISQIQRNLPADIKINVITADPKNSIDDEIRNILMKLSQSENTLILSFDSEETNLIAQTVTDQNLTEKLSIIGYNGDEKTKSFLEKGIVHADISINFRKAGISAADELFKFKKNGFCNKYIISDAVISESGKAFESEGKK